MLRIAEVLHHLVLRAYPAEYIETFGNEMHDTFLDGMNDAIAHNALASFILREVRDVPKSLLKAYWHGWSGKILSGIELLQQVATSSDLPPVQPDGRDSWWQVLLETSTFLIAGLVLLLTTYLPITGLRPGWQRDIQFLGNIVLPIAIPFLLFGLLHGLPRWVYPFAGLLLYYSIFVAGQTGLWLFLAIMLLASSVLLIAAILTDPQRSRLPIPIRRIGQSISLDWTRLSFGIYGAMPLIILTAFDDAHTNSHTPYFAFSISVMVMGALLYCRSRDTTMQLTVLLAGLTFAIWGAWLDKVSFASGLMNWTTISSMGLESITWMGILWIQWAFLILFPIVLILLNRLVHLKRAI